MLHCFACLEQHEFIDNPIRLPSCSRAPSFAMLSGTMKSKVTPAQPASDIGLGVLVDSKDLSQFISEMIYTPDPSQSPNGWLNIAFPQAKLQETAGGVTVSGALRVIARVGLAPQSGLLLLSLLLRPFCGEFILEGSGSYTTAGAPGALQIEANFSAITMIALTPATPKPVRKSKTKRRS
jgi:hypothetical protein